MLRSSGGDQGLKLFVEIDWFQSQDLTCILISEDKASAKKIKGKSGEISSGVPGDKDLLKPLSLLLVVLLSYFTKIDVISSYLYLICSFCSVGVFFIY